MLARVEMGQLAGRLDILVIILCRGSTCTLAWVEMSQLAVQIMVDTRHVVIVMICHVPVVLQQP
ncbi:MAG: hypothetical protein AAGJ74_02090, partial [Pseudomonadota bacterium]